jgi:tripartite-type tricarboxylate transporter receptor subunit TctC
MIKTLFLTLSLAAAALPAVAQDFPGSQPIRLIVPFNPGGTTDLLARSLAEFLQKRMNHTILVENRPGAATAIGTDQLAKAKPDGHTLMVAAADIAVLPAVRRNLPYNIEELTYINRFFVGLPMIVSGPKSGINTIQELIEKIKSEPGKIKNGTNGVGALNHLGALKFDTAVGGKTTHVPYGGQGPASTDTLAGVVDILNGASVPITAGLKVLAPVGAKRHPSFPDLPTLGELGYKDAEWDAWFGIVGPPKMPKEIVDKLNEQINAVLKDPVFREKITTATQTPLIDNPLTGEAFRKQTMDEFNAWKKIAERENLVVQ